jgi:hypothetical protein
VTLKKGVASLERDDLIVFYYLSSSEICPHKRGDLLWGGGFIREELL